MYTKCFWSVLLIIEKSMQLDGSHNVNLKLDKHLFLVLITYPNYHKLHLIQVISQSQWDECLSLAIVLINANITIMFHITNYVKRFLFQTDCGYILV